MSDEQLRQAYAFGRAHAGQPVQALLPHYFVTAGGQWAILSTQWAEAVLSGWYDGMPAELPADELTFLRRLDGMLIVRTADSRRVELRQDGPFVPAVEVAVVDGVRFSFYARSDFDATRPVEIEFWSGDLRLETAQWDWTALAEGDRVVPAVEQPLPPPSVEWVAYDAERGRAIYRVGAYTLTLLLTEFAIDQNAPMLRLPMRVEHGDESWDFAMVPEVEHPIGTITADAE